MAPYQAPLQGDDLPGVVPQSYVIFLHKDYSLEDHKAKLTDSVDLDKAIEFVFPETSRHGLYYTATLDDDALESVRADEGVDMVECNRKVELDAR